MTRDDIYAAARAFCENRPVTLQQLLSESRAHPLPAMRRQLFWALTVDQTAPLKRTAMALGFDDQTVRYHIRKRAALVGISETSLQGIRRAWKAMKEADQ